MGQFVQDMGAAATAPLVVIGDKLGLYKAMADGEPVTPAELAERTGCRERYLREWLCQQAASGYVEYDATASTFRLPPEQALALAHDDSPAFIPGAFQLLAAIVKDEPHITERFRTGEGFGWHEHDHDLFEGTERFFRPGYLANLVESWLPSLDGVVDEARGGRAGGRHRLRARRLDDPDGAGLPGLDVRRLRLPRGLDRGRAPRRRARRRGRPRHVRGRRPRRSFGGGPYDLVCVFDALHDMGDPVGAARHVRSQLADDGTWLVVEPFAGDARRGQPQPGRARVLRRLDDALHARAR